MSDYSALKSLIFDGDHKEYKKWSDRLLHYCNTKQCRNVLIQDQPTMPDESTVLDPLVDADKPLILLRTANALACSILSMTLKDDTGHEQLESSMSTKLPSGDARQAWINLERIYNPKTDVDLYNLRQRFTRSEFKAEGISPDIWFTELEIIRRQLMMDFGVSITDDDVIQHVVYNLKPQIYQTAIQMIKRETADPKKTSPTLEEIKAELRALFSQYVSGVTGKNSKRETALLMQSGKNKTTYAKKFKGDCRLCGKKGHKAVDCWESAKGKGSANYNMSKLQTPRVVPGDYKAKKKVCTFCGKENHTFEDCFKRKNSGKKASEITEVALMSFEKWNPDQEEEGTELCVLSGFNKEQQSELIKTSDADPNTWILDSGSTSHMRFTKSGLTNLIEWKAPITVGNKEVIYSKQKGTFKGHIVNEDGIQFSVTMDDVLYVPDLIMNLFSLTKTMKNTNIGLERVGHSLALNIDHNKLIFDKEIKGGSGNLMGIDIYPASAAELNEQATTIISHERMHELLGHPNKVVVNSTAKKYGIKIKSSLDQPCEHCAEAKSKKKKISKLNLSNVATTRGERISIDISSVKTTSKGGNKFWLLIMDEFTECIWSYFIKRKSDLPQVVYEWIMRATNQQKIRVNIIRCDNAGENLSLQKKLAHSFHCSHIKFEFTAPNTPQQNGKIERKFATLFGKCRSMLNAAGVPQHLRELLWAQCGQMATLLDKILVDDPKLKSPYELWYDKIPSWLANLKVFGEIGIVHNHSTEIKAKLENRGFPAMFIGYPLNHKNDCFQFMNLNKGSIMLSRNVVWLNKSYGEFKKVPISLRSKMTQQEAEDNDSQYSSSSNEYEQQMDNDIVERTNDNASQASSSDDGSDRAEKAPHNTLRTIPENDPDEPIMAEITDESSDSDHDDAPTTRVSGVSREHFNMRTFFNPDPSSHTEQHDEFAYQMMTLSNDESYEYALNGLPDYNPFPANFREAMNRKEKPQWWDAMCDEFRNMHDKIVWKIVKKIDLPKGRKLIGNRWVYTLKDNGIYRARTVGKGFSQVPGKDFHENHAPVLHDTTFRFCLVQKLIFHLSSLQFDIVTAFLYGDLDEVIYMVFPEGYERFLKEVMGQDFSAEDHCLLLEKALYGLVQAARQWWKKMTQVMNGLGFHPSAADPCLFVKNPEKNAPPAFVMLYVDDGGIIGTPEIIKEVLEKLSKEFQVKELGEMKHFVGCHIIENKSRDTIWINQPKLIKNLEENFRSLITSEKVYKTPASPRFIVIRPMKDDPVLSLDRQQKYRSGVGMLMYLVKHSRPDIANATRELSKVLDGATEAHWKAMLRIIKFVFDTKMVSLKLKPYLQDKKVHVRGISDSEFAGDTDTRRSVYGYIVYYCGAPISWKSKSGNSVTLSSTEAEYFASSETAKELLFVYNLVKSMELNLELPMILNVDNTGAIYLANNYTTGPRTKHIDIRVHFVRDLIVAEILRVVFVRTDDNDADIFTKNVGEELFDRHSVKLVEDLK